MLMIFMARIAGRSSVAGHACFCLAVFRGGPVDNVCGSVGPGGVLSHRAFQVVAHELLVEARRAGTRLVLVGGKRDEDRGQYLVDQVQLHRHRRTNSNLVSAMMIPRSSAKAAHSL